MDLDEDQLFKTLGDALRPSKENESMTALASKPFTKEFIKKIYGKKDYSFKEVLRLFRMGIIIPTTLSGYKVYTIEIKFDHVVKSEAWYDVEAFNKMKEWEKERTKGL